MRKFFALLILCVGAANADLPAATADPPAADVQAGRRKYLMLCAACHGAQGRGDGPAASRLDPPPRNHTDGKVMNALSDDHIFRTIKSGGAAVGKSPSMPAWGSALGDQDIWNLVAYIRTLARPRKKLSAQTPPGSVGRDGGREGSGRGGFSGR